MGTERQCPDVKDYKWRLNPVWRRMLYSYTHMATVGVKFYKNATSGLHSRCTLDVMSPCRQGRFLSINLDPLTFSDGDISRSAGERRRQTDRKHCYLVHSARNLYLLLSTNNWKDDDAIPLTTRWCTVSHQFALLLQRWSYSKQNLGVLYVYTSAS